MGEVTPLKPCPFCASTEIDPEGWSSIDRSGPACDDCGASADSVAAWNKRPPPYDAAAEVAALGTALTEARDLIEAALSPAEGRAAIKEDGR
jgi:hypothetical protein